MKTTILVLLSLMSAAALALGTVGGGGGGVYLCSGNDVQLVDLFEAETVGLKINYDNVTPLEQQIEKVVARVKMISPRFGADVAAMMTVVQTNPGGGAGVSIPKPSDVDEKYGKKGCTLTGMMYFDDNWNKLIRDTNLFDHQKTTTDYVAAYLHEAIYKVMRDQRMPASGDSVLTRRIVGCVMSDKDIGECLGLTKQTPIVKDDAWKCDVVDKNGTPISFTMYDPDGFMTWSIQIDKYGADDIIYQSRSVYYRDGMFGDRGDSTRVGNFFGSPDSGGRFVYLEGLGGVGNVVRHMLPGLTVLEPRLKIKVPGTGKVVACKPLGRSTPIPKSPTCKMTSPLQQCIGLMEQGRRSKRDTKKPIAQDDHGNCRVTLKDGDSCACAKQENDFFSYDEITCTGPR